MLFAVQVHLQTNQFQMELNPYQQIYRYDVDVNLLVADDHGRCTKVSLLEGDKDE